MGEYLKDRASFIIIIVVLVVGFGFFAMKGSGDSSNAQQQAASSKPPAKVSFQSPMSKGSQKAAVSLIQYSDFLCPSCSYFTTQIMPQVEQKYISTGKVAFEFRPMAFIATGSTLAGEGAYCAIDQTKFWQYHDAIYNYVWTNAFSKGVDPKSTTILTTPVIEQIATTAGLDNTSFSSCLNGGGYADRIASVTNTANQQGITSTPYIMVNGKPLNGNVSLQSVEALIESQL